MDFFNAFNRKILVGIAYLYCKTGTATTGAAGIRIFKSEAT
jgi:hypothetical protein